MMTTKSPFLISDSFQPVPVHLNYVLVKISSSDRARVLAELEKAWKDINPGYAFEYRLVDEEIARQLDEANLAFEYVLKLCTILAFALSGLGLFGLSTYEIERRTKEVGIRKALGATSLQIAGHFLGGFFRLARSRTSSPGPSPSPSSGPCSPWSNIPIPCSSGPPPSSRPGRSPSP